MYAKKENNQWWLYFDTVEEIKALYKKEEKDLWECLVLGDWLGRRSLSIIMKETCYRRKLTDEFEVRKSFEVDDPVCWCGVNGEVAAVPEEYECCVEVRFNINKSTTRCFYHDGRYLLFHKTPSLFHGHDVLRPEDQKFPVTRKEREEAELTRLKEFERVVRPVIKFLNDNYHPHVQAVITPTSAELAEGVLSTGQIPDYVKD